VFFGTRKKDGWKLKNLLHELLGKTESW
jgi:hypothetical protein